MRDNYTEAAHQGHLDPDSQLSEEDNGAQIFLAVEDLLGEAQYQWDDEEWQKVLAVLSQVRVQLTEISKLAQEEMDHQAAEKMASDINAVDQQSLEEFRAEEYWAEKQMGEHELDQDRELGNTEVDGE